MPLHGQCLLAMSAKDSPEEMERALPYKPYGNIMLLSPFDEVVDVVCQVGVEVVCNGAGNPAIHGKFAKQNTALQLASVVMKRMEKEGADAVVVEGTARCGHIGAPAFAAPSLRRCGKHSKLVLSEFAEVGNELPEDRRL